MDRAFNDGSPSTRAIATGFGQVQGVAIIYLRIGNFTGFIGQCRYDMKTFGVREAILIVGCCPVKRAIAKTVNLHDVRLAIPV